jgi:hypothetical protein
MVELDRLVFAVSLGLRVAHFPTICARQPTDGVFCYQVGFEPFPR